MKEVISIKGHRFGPGRPVVCVPVAEQSGEAVLDMVQELTAQGAEMLEWRMDWYRDVKEQGAVCELLEKIKPYVEKTVFLCTLRSKKQGGVCTMSGEQYLRLNCQAAKTGVPDLLDLEYFEIEGAQEAVAQLQRDGVRVICSNHNFQRTPPMGEMEHQLEQMIQSGADFSKLAVMPAEKTQVLHLMEAVLHVKERYPKSHLIAMSMDSKGVITRLLGGWFWSEITFGAYRKSSAPGQIDYKRAEEIVAALEECIRE